ncbi:uncharacterized protein [Diabrotica undecimpunctata]|uniref:uncharacterized protein isoform X2 n=1 Tax=Diabrotica undecimpunctata TaxID=50387 RepID=UPI003B635382
MEVIKQEISEDTCEVKIENNGLDEALLDSFKYEIKVEPNLENIDYTSDCLALKEFPVKTEVEQDGKILICFKEKQKTKEGFQL